MWGRGPESRREGSTRETGGSPPPGGPLWYPPAPGRDTEKRKGGECEGNKKYASGNSPNGSLRDGNFSTHKSCRVSAHKALLKAGLESVCILLLIKFQFGIWYVTSTFHLSQEDNDDDDR